MKLHAPAIAAVLFVSAPAFANPAQDVENCTSQIAAAARHVAALVAFDPDGETAAFDEHVADFNDRREQARLCASQLPAGADRTRLVAAYEQLRTTATAQVKTSIEKFRELVGFKRDIARLHREIESAPAGTAHDAAVAALLERIARAGNPYASEAWRTRQRAWFDEPLAAHRRARASAAADAERARIERNTVLSRLPAFASIDASKPARIADAFEAATAADLVVATADATYAPVPTAPIVVDRHVRKTAAPEEPGIVTFTEDTDTAITVRFRAELPRLPAGTPALVWEVVEPGIVAIVTMDGGRYVIETAHLAAGAGARSTWPARPLHTAITDPEIAALARIGVLDAHRAAAVAAPQKAYRDCATRLWRANDAAFDAIAAANITDAAKAARVDQLNTRVRRSVDAQCGRHTTAFDKAWRAAHADYARLRTAALARIRKRLEQLVAP